MQSQLEKIAPTWSDVSIKMKDDPEADNAFGWVLEMYVKFRRCLSVHSLCKFAWFVVHPVLDSNLVDVGNVTV